MAAPVPGHAWSSPFLCALSGPDTEPMAAGQEATAADGAPMGGWRTDLAHLWGGANPAQPEPPLHSAPLHARPRSVPNGSAERARRPLGGSPDRASPRGAAARKRQRIGGWAAEPGAAETPATLAARSRRVGKRDMTCDGGGCGDIGAAVEAIGAGAAEVLATLQRPRERGCCESGGATAEPAELARPEEAGSMGACTLGASPARMRVCREGSTRERTTPVTAAAAVAAAEAEVAAAVAAAEAEVEAAGAAAESEAEAAEDPLMALPPKKRARLEGSACGEAVATDTGAAAGVAGTAARPKRLPGGNPLNVRMVSAYALFCLGTKSLVSGCIPFQVKRNRNAFISLKGCWLLFSWNMDWAHSICDGMDREGCLLHAHGHSKADVLRDQGLGTYFLIPRLCCAESLATAPGGSNPRQFNRV